MPKTPDPAPSKPEDSGSPSWAEREAKEGLAHTPARDLSADLKITPPGIQTGAENQTVTGVTHDAQDPGIEDSDANKEEGSAGKPSNTTPASKAK